MPEFREDIHVAGRLSCTRFSAPDGSIGSDAIDPDDPITEDKTFHRVLIPHAQGSTTAAFDERKMIYHAYQDGIITSVKVGVMDRAVGDSTVTVDIKKNDVTILTVIITLTNADLDRTFQYGSLVADPSYDEDDVFEVVIDATVGTGTLPKGVYVQMVAVETPTGA